MEPNDSNSNVPETTDAADALAQFEQDKLNRRAALRKIGLTTGMALFAMFGTDDLARLAARKLERYKHDSVIADAVAKDFKNIGIAFASDNNGCVSDCVPNDEHDCIADGCMPGTLKPAITCDFCYRYFNKHQNDPVDHYYICLGNHTVPDVCKEIADREANDLEYYFAQCKAKHCTQA